MRNNYVFFILLLFTACVKPVFKSKWTTQQAPASFVARFETTKGVFDVEVKRERSPLAVDRLYQLLQHHYYDGTIFYRVVPNFVAQFGSFDTVLTKHWGAYKLPDEPVLFSNKKGTLSFARSGVQTRGNALYINLRDNPRLDTLHANNVTGYPAFGEVKYGMEVVQALYTGYAETTMKELRTLRNNRTAFLQTFPLLDSISKAYVLKK